MLFVLSVTRAMLKDIRQVGELSETVRSRRQS
jgi:hypothetical protein